MSRRRDTSVNLTSEPAGILDGNIFLILYGTSNGLQTNTGYTTIVGFASGAPAFLSTRPDNLSTPTQAGLAFLGSTLYVIQQQNNSTDGVFVAQIDQTGTYIPGTSYQIANGVRVAGGISAVTEDNTITFVGKSFNSSELYEYYSTDGQNWSAKGYSGIQTNASPSITLFNSQFCLAIKSNDSRDILFATTSAF